MTLCTCMRSASHHLLFFDPYIQYYYYISIYVFLLHLGIKGCIVLRTTHTHGHTHNADIIIIIIITMYRNETKILIRGLAMNLCIQYFRISNAIQTNIWGIRRYSMYKDRSTCKKDIGV